MRFGHLGLSLAVLASMASPAMANTKTHDFGPHTRAEVYAVCDAALGHRTGSMSKWGCDAPHWTIACISYGRTCSISLITMMETEGPVVPKPLPASTLPQKGNGLSGKGGAAAIGSKAGGGTMGSIGK